MSSCCLVSGLAAGLLDEEGVVSFNWDVRWFTSWLAFPPTSTGVEFPMKTHRDMPFYYLRRLWPCKRTGFANA